MGNIHRALVICLITGGASLDGALAQAVTTVGSLSNFDCVNDTGGETEGFEIELEGLHSSDVYSTFGAPYNRYGDPEVVDTATGVTLRWAATYDPVAGVFDTATPIAAADVGPGGHDCYSGGPIGNYEASGCEHFGVSTAKAPTSTSYSWLAADPDNAGQLINGGRVSIPAPLFSVAAPPQPGNPPAMVQAAFEAPREDGDQREFGDAFWAKVIKTEVHKQAGDLLLNDLLFNSENDPNDLGLFMEDGQDQETEIEWFIVQNALAGREIENAVATEILLDTGDKGVAYRYEFYSYAGGFDPENHEALPINDSLPDPTDIGGYIGAQMAGVNLNNIPVPEPSTLALAAVMLGSIAVSRQTRRH